RWGSKTLLGRGLRVDAGGGCGCFGRGINHWSSAACVPLPFVRPSGGFRRVPERKEIIPLERVAFNDGFEVGGKTNSAGAQVGIALVARWHFGVLGRKTHETVMAAGFALAEHVNQRRTRD